ncbi:MAG: DUF1501 domain-containing protein [Planctomycetes bacterium]|nr:DUF1501 domain-containing protein [Planctomycetota bacterium]
MASLLPTRGVSRRGFLRLGMLGGVGVGLSDVLRSQALAADEDEIKTPEGKAKNVVMVWLGGGPSTIDMWDLKPDAPDNIKGPFQPIDSSAEGIQISDKLPQMAQVMDRATVIRSLAHSIPAHGPGTVYMNTGNKPSPAMRYPSLGSLTSRLLEAPAEVPAYVNFGNDRSGGANAGYLGAAWNPFRVQNGEVRGVTLPEDVTVDDLADRVRLLDTFDNRLSVLNEVAEVVSGIDQFQQKALDILRSDKTRNAFNLNEESDATRQRYGNDGFGRSALSARRLVEAGVRFVTLGTGGWDTHGNNFNSLQNRLLPPIDRTVSALIEDLDDKGLLDSTIVYVAGEFGRTPRINGNSGRDHWARSMAVVLAGGGFPKGMAYGTTNDQGMKPDENPCSPEDVSATIIAALGVPKDKTLQTRTGRPLQLFREGTAIDALLG